MSLGICQQCGQGAELLNGKTCIGCDTWDAGTAGDVAFAMKHGRWINPCDVEDEDATRIPNAAYGLLTEQEVFLWAYLEFRQGQNNSSHCSIPGIARQLHWSPSKVQRWTKSLVAKGWLKTWLDTHPVSGKTRKHYSVMNRVSRQD